MDKSPEDIAVERLRMDARVLTPAAEPAGINRAVAAVQRERFEKELGEYPIRIAPEIRVILGAVCNNVNDVVDEVQQVDIDGSDQIINLRLPLSRKKGGVAYRPFEAVFRFVGDLASKNYLILADGEDGAKRRINSYVASINEKLSMLFEGEVLEQENMQYSIDRADLFKTNVELVYNRIDTPDAETVNEVQVIVNIYIHVNDLTNMDNADTFNTRYKTLVRNAASACGVPTSLYVAFDVSNFLVRQSTLALFNSLLLSETVKVLSVEAVKGNPPYLPIEASTIVGVELTK